MTRQKKDYRIYLQDILSAINRIEKYTEEGEAVFFTDDKTQDAVIRQFSILGEAAAKLPSSIKAKHNTTSWKDIVGMRNIIVHEYSETDLPTVWGTVRQGLPSLKKTVEKMLREDKI